MLRQQKALVTHDSYTYPELKPCSSSRSRPGSNVFRPLGVLTTCCQKLVGFPSNGEVVTLTPRQLTNKITDVSSQDLGFDASVPPDVLDEELRGKALAGGGEAL